MRTRCSSCFYPALLSAAVAIMSCACGGPSISADELDLDKNMEVVATSTRQWTGVAVAEESRIFVSYPNWSSSHTVSVAEVGAASAVTAFPDATWNTWHEGLNASEHFICVQAIFIDRNNFLWVLDAANIQRNGEHAGVREGGAKLLKFNIQSRELVQSIVFREPFIKKTSYLNDVRIDEDRNIAYLTDSGKGALVIVDLTTGSCRRVFDNDAATKSENKVLTIEGTPYRNAKGEYPAIHSDGIALNKDRTYLYWRALTGESLYRISTAALNNTSMNDEALSRLVEKSGPFPPSDGMIFGFYGELYLTSIEENAIRAYNHGNETRLIRQRDDIKWPDSFAVSEDGFLYFTTSQIHITHPTEPYKLFRIQIRF